MCRIFHEKLFAADCIQKLKTSIDSIESIVYAG